MNELLLHTMSISPATDGYTIYPGYSLRSFTVQAECAGAIAQLQASHTEEVQNGFRVQRELPHGTRPHGDTGHLNKSVIHANTTL